VITNIRQYVMSYALTTWVACAYLLFSHLPGTAAMVNILVGLMLVSTVTLLVRHRIVFNAKSGLVWAFASFLVVVLASVLLSPYLEESLRPLRRDILPMVLVFVLLAAQRRNKVESDRMAQLAIWAIVAAFLLRTVLAFGDWWGQGFENDAYSIDRNIARFFDFFAIDAAIMMPVATAALLYLPMRIWARVVLGTLLVMAYVLVVISGIRAALLTVSLVTLLQLAPLLWRFKWVTLVVVSVSLAGAMTFFMPRIDKLTERYATIVTVSTYQASDQGYSSFYERRSIWKGALDMIKDRPLLGYGLGWQKFYNVAHEKGYYDKWKQSDKQIDKAVVKYFDYVNYGSANPHNVWVQILFETGVLGLLAYASMLAILCYRAIRALRHKYQAGVAQCFAYGTLAYLVSYFMINMMNGLWLGAGATLTLLAVSEMLLGTDESQPNAG
jgi:O-antigen ligase